MDTGRLDPYRVCTPVADAQYGPDIGRSPSEVIIDTLAEAAGEDPREFTPLYEFVDLDAIDALFDRHNVSREAQALLSFQVDTWNVFVHHDGRIRVCDWTRTTDPDPVFENRTA